jgi:iron complex outermembrane receptor protein
VPREADAYGLELNLQTINLDFTQAYGDLFLALGTELRTDKYKIIPGEEYSYRDYDTEDGQSLFPEDRSAAIQGFNGIGPQSAVDETRDVFSVYAEAEYQATDRLFGSVAARYDDYDGFGDTVNFKLAANFAITDSFSIRGGASTGFRAPSMQQLYFNNISTQFVVDPDTGELIPQQVGTFRNDSSLAQAIGIPELKEEESTNLSIGIVADIAEWFSLTLDFYSIDIEDRIVISNRLGPGLSPPLDAALIQAGAGAGQFFLNGADTETRGVDLVATFGGLMLLGGDLDMTLAANFTDTEVTDLYTPPGSGLAPVDVEDVFNEQDISIIEEWQPKDRVSFNAFWTWSALSVNLALNRYGEYTVTDGGRQTYGAEVLTDLNVSWLFDNGLRLFIAGNNIFDVTPDRNVIGNSRAGAIEATPGGTIIVDSDGVFDFSRRAAPFGFNGAYYSAGLTWDF